MEEPVIIGIAGRVVALDRSTGGELWRTALKGGDFVTVSRDGREVFAATKGRLFCLDASTGNLKWVNELKGLGFGLVSIAGGESLPTVAERGRREAAAAT